MKDKNYLKNVTFILNVFFYYITFKMNVNNKEDIMSNFSKTLKYYRELYGVTQKQMAEKLQMTPNAYQKYELGTREPNLSNLIQIADILEVSLDDLVGRHFTKSSLMNPK